MGAPGDTDILSEAYSLVRGERLKFYGPPTENFARIARQWSAYLGVGQQVENVKRALKEAVAEMEREHHAFLPAFQRIDEALDAVNTEVTSDDVCCMMILLKVARIRTGGSYHRDSAVDAAGYAALLEILNEGVNVDAD